MIKGSLYCYACLSYIRCSLMLYPNIEDPGVGNGVKSVEQKGFLPLQIRPAEGKGLLAAYPLSRESVEFWIMSLL